MAIGHSWLGIFPLHSHVLADLYQLHSLSFIDTVDLFLMLTRLPVVLEVLEEPPALMSRSQRPACQVIIFHSLLSSSLDLCFLSKI